MKRATYKEIRCAILNLTDEELYTTTEIKHFIEDYYGNQLFIDYGIVDNILSKFLSNHWNYLNAIYVNGIAYYWFSIIAYNEMKRRIEHKEAKRGSTKYINVKSH